MFFKIVLLKICNIRQEIPVLEFIFNKVVGYQAWNFIKKRLQHRCVSVTLATFLRTTIFTEHLRWLLLSIDYVNIYLFSIFFSIDFARWKSVRLRRTLLISWCFNFKKCLKHFHNMYPWSRNKNNIVNALSSMNKQSNFKSAKST